MLIAIFAFIGYIILILIHLAVKIYFLENDRTHNNKGDVYKIENRTDNKSVLEPIRECYKMECLE